VPLVHYLLSLGLVNSEIFCVHFKRKFHLISFEIRYMLSAAPHNLFIFLSLQGPGKQSAEWQPSSLSLKPDKSPNIVRHICQQQFFSFQSILDPTLLPTIHRCLFEDKSADKWVVDLFYSRNIQNNQFTGWIPPGLKPPTFMYAFFSHNLNSSFLASSICVWDVDDIHHCSIYALTKVL